MSKAAVKPGDKITWDQAECIRRDAPAIITWAMASKGYCVVLDLAPGGLPFGSFEESPEFVFELEKPFQ